MTPVQHMRPPKRAPRWLEENPRGARRFQDGPYLYGPRGSQKIPRRFKSANNECIFQFCLTFYVLSIFGLPRHPREVLHVLSVLRPRPLLLPSLFAPVPNSSFAFPPVTAREGSAPELLIKL